MFRIDSTDERHIARYINDDERNPNLIAKRIVVLKKPTIVFFATRDIKIDDELCYDYGEGHHFWRLVVPEAVTHKTHLFTV